MQDDLSIFRNFEQKLDSHYKTMHLMQEEIGKAIYAILAGMDGIYLCLLLRNEKADHPGEAKMLKSYEDGFQQAMRWISRGRREIPVCSVANGDLINDGMEFIDYSSKYIDIADFHKMFGRGQVDIKVNMERRTVRFVLKNANGRSPVDGYIEDVHSQTIKANELAKKYEVDQNIPERQELWKFISADTYNGRVVIGNLSEQAKSFLGFYANLYFIEETVPLNSMIEMDGFTVADHHKFCHSVLMISIATLSYYLHLTMSRIKLQYECMPTQIWNKKDLLGIIANYSGLTPDVVTLIIDRLTFNSISNSDIYLQPFVCEKESIAWSPVCFIFRRHERNLLRVLARDPKTNSMAATIIGSRERPLIRLIANLFNKYGYDYKFMSNLNDNIEIDVLLYQRKHPNQVLIIGAKAILAPDEVNEIKDAIETMRYGQEQLRRIIDTMKGMQNKKMKELFKFVNWDSVQEIFGVVVSSDGDPNETLDPNQFPAISYNTITARLRSSDFRAPKRFWTACKERKWLRTIAKCEKTCTPIQIGDLTYELPSITI